MVLGIAWQTWLMAHLDQARGVFLVFYLLPLLFGLFHLSRRAYLRSAALIFFCFAGVNLWDGYRLLLGDPQLAALQVCVLLVMLVWMCLYAAYVQASRSRMRQRRFALQAHQDTLRGMMRQLEDLVATDELTGLFNRRHFLRIASRELQAMDQEQVHGLALIDLDLSRYDVIAQRFADDQRDAVDFLKRGIATRNAKFNALITEIERVALRSRAPILLLSLIHI